MRGKLEDAEILYSAGSFDSSYYLCGYAVELALKARIVKHLKWDGLPESGKLFSVIAKHEFDYLLQFTGIEAKLKPALQTEWSEVLKWNPELRYTHGVKTKADAKNMLDSAKRLIEVIKR